MSQYPRKQDNHEWRGGRPDERERQSRGFPDDYDDDDRNRGFGGRAERDYGWQEEQGFNRRSGRDWRDDERMNWEHYGDDRYRGEPQRNRGYRPQEMMESRGMQGSRNREDFGRQGGYGPEGRGHPDWGGEYGPGWQGGQGGGYAREGGFRGQGGYGSQGGYGDQGGYGRQGGYGGQGWQGEGQSQRERGNFGQTGEQWQGRGYGQGGSYAQTGKYGQIGAQMSGGRFGEGYGQGAYGGFRGKGPKGYERSDERLKEIISERLTDDDQIDASEITVEVRNGEVTLSGTVDDRSMKFQVEDAVERCGGVKEIHNNLRVTPVGQTGQTGQTGKKDMMTTKAGSRGGNSE